MTKIFLILTIFFSTLFCYSQIDANSLMGLPNAVDIAEINTITNPQIGSVVYNIDDENIYRYTGVTNGWQRGLGDMSVYTGTFIISSEGTVTITNIPFQPSQVTFVANANVESLNLDSDNGTGNNDRGIDNSFGTMNGFARNVNGTLVQQVIFGGGHANSINDLSRYASSSNCIGIRYGDQNGNSLGKIEGSFGTFTTNGFTINVEYTNGTVTINY